MAASNIVKCASCNILINEVLAFIQNKLRVMDNESLVRLCVTGFKEEEISKAKELLYDSLPTKKRKISRRKDGKVQRELEDIICVFKETDAEQFPIFVARDLHKLPPVTFDHIDVTRVLKDLLILQEEVKHIKSNYVTRDMLQVNNVVTASSGCQETLNHRATAPRSPPASCNNINNRRGASNANVSICLDSGLDGLQSIIYHDNNNKLTTLSDECESKMTSSQIETEPSDPQPSLPAKDIDGAMKLSPDATLAEVVSKEGEWKRNEPSDEWKEVRRRRYRNRFEGKTGKAPSEGNCKFKAAESKVLLFISNVHKDTSEKDIIDYIYGNTQEVVRLQKINMKFDKGYNSYKIWVSKWKLNLYLNDTLWPEGISFRHFVHFRRSPNSDLVKLQTT